MPGMSYVNVEYSHTSEGLSFDLSVSVKPDVTPQQVSDASRTFVNRVDAVGFPEPCSPSDVYKKQSFRLRPSGKLPRLQTRIRADQRFGEADELGCRRCRGHRGALGRHLEVPWRESSRNEARVGRGTWTWGSDQRGRRDRRRRWGGARTTVPGGGGELVCLSTENYVPLRSDSLIEHGYPKLARGAPDFPAFEAEVLDYRARRRADAANAGSKRAGSSSLEPMTS